MKPLLRLLSTHSQSSVATLIAFISLVTVPIAQANQINEFSVFQPVNGVSANIYIDQSRIMVQSTNTPTTALNSIKPEYLTKYSNQLYKLSDVDHNGTVDIATLDRVDRSATRFCYKVYSYELQSRQFSTRPTYTECDSTAGTVIYAANSDIAINH